MNPAVKILGTSAGIGVAIILGFIIYGELTRPVGFEFNEGTWIVGNGLSKGLMLKYDIEKPEKSMLVRLDFKDKVDGNWLVMITINDDQDNAKEVILSDTLVGVDIPEDFEEWKDIKDTLLWIVNYVFEPKPLVANSVWSTIQYKLQTVEFKLVAKEDISIASGNFNAFKLAYYLGYQGGGEFWIVKDMPLPIKAEVKDQDGMLEFRYELVDYSL